MGERENSGSQRRAPRSKTLISAIVDGNEYVVGEWNNKGCRIHSSILGEIGSNIDCVIVFDSDDSLYRVSTKAEIKWVNNGFTGVEFKDFPSEGNVILSYKLREALGLVGKKSANAETVEEFVSDEDQYAAKILKTIKSKIAVSGSRRFVSSQLFRKVFFFFAIILSSGLLLFIYSRSRYLYVSGKIGLDELPIVSNFKGSLLRLEAQTGTNVKIGTPLLLAVDEVELRENEKTLETLSRLNDLYIQQYSLLPGTSSSEELKSLKNKLAKAESIVKRYQYLFDNGAISEELLAEKKYEYQSLEFDIKAKENNSSLYKNVKTRLDERIEARLTPFGSRRLLPENKSYSFLDGYQNGLRIVTSPVNGRIKKIPYAEGSVVRPGSTLFIISNNDKPIFKAYLPQDQARSISIGNSVEIVLPTSYDNLKGEVTLIDYNGGYDHSNTHDQLRKNFLDETYRLGETPAEITVLAKKSDLANISLANGLEVELRIEKN